MIFDSDVLIWCLRGDDSAARFIDGETERATSIISLIELLQGARSLAEMRVVKGFIARQRIVVLPVTESIGYSALKLIERHAHSHGLRLADAFVAATARECGETLATGNVRHFKFILGLSLKPFVRVSA